MSKHTPAPWAIQNSSQGYPYQIIALNGDDKKPGKVGSKVLRWGCFTLPSSQEAFANARLIAASPELLEALRFYLKAGIYQSTDFEIQGQAYKLAHAAIAKAEGVA